MKKISFILLSVTIATALQAQFGVKGGINVSSWRGGSATGAASKVGFYGGVFYNLGIGSGTFSIQPEAVFSSEGAKNKDGSSIKYTTDFANISCLARFNTKGFFGGMGPQAGILVNAKREYMGDKDDVKDLFKSVNFSWAFAVGYELDNGLGLYARYNLGLSNFSDVNDADLKTSAFHTGLRYSIKGKNSK